MNAKGCKSVLGLLLTAALATGSAGCGGGSASVPPPPPPPPPPTFTVTTSSLPNGTVNVPYSATLQSSGGTPPVTWSIATTALPPGLSLSSGGTISGTPATPGSSCFESNATDSSTLPQAATQGLCIGINSSDMSHNGLLKGHYAFVTSGFSHLSGILVPIQAATAGSFVADGNGNFTSGVFDTGGLTATNQPLTGTYALGSDNRGTMSINSSGGTTTLAFAVGSISSSGVATKGRIIQFAAAAVALAGEFELQDTTAFSNSALSGSYAFVMSGWGPIQKQFGADGVLTANGTGSIPSGTADQNLGGTVVANQPLTGDYSVDAGSAAGRGTGRLNISGTTLNFVFYVVSASKLLIVSAQQAINPLVFIGQVLKQSGGPFSNGSLSGTSIFNTMGMGTIHDVTAGLYNFDGTGTTTVLEDENSAGSLTLASTLSAAYSVQPDGRVSVTIGGSTVSVLYLVSSDEGFILNTDPNAATGFFEPQAPALFTESSINGKFFFSDLPPSCCTTVSSGVAALNAGTISQTSDIDQRGTFSYSFTSVYGQASLDTYTVASNGRATTASGNEVIYIISPNKFLVIDVNSADSNPGIKVAEQ